MENSPGLGEYSDKLLYRKYLFGWKGQKAF